MPGAITLNHDLVIAAGATGATTASLTLSGGITGTGNILINYSATALTGAVTISNAVNNLGSITNTSNTTGVVTISAAIGNNVTGLTQNSASSILSLTGNNRNFSGNATVTNGTLRIGNIAALNAANTVSLAANGSLNLNAFDVTIAGLIGSGTATNSGAAKTLTLGGNGNYTFGGVITGTTPANMALTVALTGGGSQTLTGISTYTGATTLNRGMLVLDFDQASTQTNLISNSSALVLGGGILSVIGDALASSQTFASTTLTTGTYNVVSATAGAGGLALDLATLTRNLNSGLNINLVNNPTITLSGVSATNGVAVGSNGVAFLTLNGTDWGTLSGNNPVAATYQNDNFSAPTNNVNVTASGSWSGTTVNTLRFNAGAPILTLSGSNTLSAGGLLVGSGAGTVTIGGTGTLNGTAAGGTVAAPVNGELGVFQHSASVLTVSAPIVNHASGLSYVTATPTGTALNKYGTGTLVLGSTRNAYTGGTNIANGVLRLGAAEVLPDGAAQPGAVTVAAPATLDLAGFSETINGLAGAGTVDNTSATAATLYVGNTNATSTFSGVLQNTGGAANLALTKIGSGTLTLSSANTYGGATTINLGGITLNFTLAGAPLTNIISGASALNLGSGTLTVTGSTTVNAQSFNGSSLSGGGRVTLSGTTPALTVNLGAITRAANSGATVNVTLVSPGVVTTTNSNDATGILGGWAVVNSADFAAVSGGNIVAYAAYTTVAGVTGAGNAAQNALFSAGNSINAATVDYNTIKLTAAPSFATATNILRLGAVGAILLPTGGAATSIGSAAGNGILTAGGAANIAGELNLINWSANALTVNSVISNNGTGVVTLVKSGTGGVTLAGTNTYTGGTIINGGTLSITAANQISSGGVTLNGGTLSFATDASLTPVFTLGAGGGTLALSGISGGDKNYGATGNIGTTGSGPRTFSVTGGGDNRRHILQSNLIDGSGGATSLVLSFGGDNRTLRISGTNTYTGTTFITRGVLDFLAVTGIPGGITSAATTGNIIFGATTTTRAILQSSVATPVTLSRGLGYGGGQIHWEGNGGFSNNVANTTWAINLGGTGQPLVWGLGGFVPTGSSLQFGVASITNSVTNLGAVDFQNDIDLGGVLRIIDAASATDKHGNTPYDVILSGDLISSAGGGFNKTGSGIMILSGTNNTSATTSVTLTAGTLFFANASAIPGSGANLTLSTTAGGNSAFGLVGDTNPIASLGSRILNPLTATSAFTLGADSSANLDFTAFPNMRLAAYAFGLPAKAITYTGTITPANSTYLFGGTPYASDAANTLATTLVLANRNALTGINAVSMGFGNLTLLSSNNFTGGILLDGAAVSVPVLAIGSNSALGTGTVTLGGNQTKSIGAVNGDHFLANNIAWAGSGTSWVMGADTGNDGVSGTSNGGGMTYLGTITISNAATAPAILSRTSHLVLILGDVANGVLTSGLTYSASTSGLISSLATAANGGVAKTYTGLNIINDAATLVIDDNLSLGNASNQLRMGSSTATSTLRTQPGVSAVSLGSRDIIMRGDSNQLIQVGRGSTLTIGGIISSSAVNAAARTFTKADNGTLVLTNKNTYAGAATFSNSLVIRGGTLQLDSGSGSFTAPGDRFFADASNALAIAFSATTGTFAGGATLEIIQASGNAFALTQGFGNLTFNTGANTIKLTNNSATQGLTLGLGSTFTRATLIGGTVNFATASAGGLNTISSTVAIANDIIGGYATFNGLDWATQTSGVIGAYSGYTTLATASNNAATNFVLTTGTVALSTSNASVNSLKLVGSAGGTNVTLNGTMTVTSRGVLFDNTSGSATISGGTQLGVTGTEVIVHTYGSGDINANKLTLNGVIKGSATVLTKAGPGTLVLSGANTYTGALIINAGVVEYSNGSAGSQNLGNPTAGAANILLNGGTLRQTATNNLIYGITVNGYSKLDVPTSVTLNQTAQGITGKPGVTGILQKTGVGTLTFSGTTDNPTLSLEVVGGTVNLGKTSTSAVHSVGVAAGSTAAATMGAALIIGSGATVSITGTGNDQIHDQSSVVVRSGGIFNLGGGSATAESFDSLAGTGSVTNNNLTGTFSLTVGAGNNVNVSAYSVAAADAGVAATGLNNFGGVISDGGAGKVVALTKTGSGTQILSGQNTYSGATTVAAGTLQLGIANALSSGAGKGDLLIVGNGSGAGSINGGTSIGTADKILAPGTLDMGGFDQAINGLNSTTGGYILNTPTLSWNGTAWVAAASTNALTLGNGDASGSFNGTLADGYTVAPGAITAQAYIGTLALTKVGSGTQSLSGTSTYTGGTLISGGTLRAMSNAALGAATGSMTITNNATLQAGANIDTGTGRAFAIGTGGARIDTNGNNVIVGGAISGTTGLQKDGTGKLEFNGAGANSYSGTATVNAGTLAVNTNLSSASIDVQSGATLSGGGSVGAVTVRSGGTVAPGNSPAILTTADFDLKVGSHLDLELGNTVAGGLDGYDQIHATPLSVGVTLAGDVRITLFNGWSDTIGATYTIILNSSLLPTFGAFSNTLTTEGWIASEDGGRLFSVNYAANVDGGNNDVTLTLQAVPEPNAFMTLVASLGLGIGLQRFRRRR